MNFTIFLGGKCNLDCPYCHRETGKEQGISPAFLDELKGAERIRFMGGEPTLYMDEIKKVVEACPDAKFAITTNGVLFDKYRDYFLKHKFHVCFSYDGKNGVRGFDPFTKKLDYPWVAVSCTLYHGNFSFKDILLEFAKKEEIIGRPLGFFPHIAHQTYSGNMSYGLSEPELHLVYVQYQEAIGRFVDDFKLGLINTRWRAIMYQLLKRYHAGYEFGETYCVNRNLRKTDASGQSFSCHYIRDEKVESKNDLAAIIKDRFPDCASCAVYDMCGAACIKSKRHELECRFYRKLFTWFREFYKSEEAVMRKIEGAIL